MQLGTSGTKLDFHKKVKKEARNRANVAACKGLSNWNKAKHLKQKLRSEWMFAM